MMSFTIYTKAALDQLLGAPTAAGRALFEAPSLEAQQSLLGVGDMLTQSAAPSLIRSEVFSMLQAGANVSLDKQTGTGKVIISASGGGGGGSGGASTLEELADVTVVGQTAGAALVSNGTGAWAPSDAAVVLEGDARLSDARTPTAHSHTMSGVSDLDPSTIVRSTRTVNSKPLSADVTLAASDVGAVPTTRTVNNKVLSANISLAASDVGAVPAARTVNGKALSADITLAATDVGAASTTQGAKADSAIQQAGLDAAVLAVKNRPWGRTLFNSASSVALTKNADNRITMHEGELGAGMLYSSVNGGGMQIPEDGVYWWSYRSAIMGTGYGLYVTQLRYMRSGVSTIFAHNTREYQGEDIGESMSDSGLWRFQTGDIIYMTIRPTFDNVSVYGAWSAGEGARINLMKVAD